MEALEDLAGVIGYAGSGSMCITYPSVFLAVNWSDFFSALFDQVPDMQVPGLLTPESGQMVAPGPAVIQKQHPEPCCFQHPSGLRATPYAV